MIVSLVFASPSTALQALRINFRFAEAKQSRLCDGGTGLPRRWGTMPQPVLSGWLTSQSKGSSQRRFNLMSSHSTRLSPDNFQILAVAIARNFARGGQSLVNLCAAEVGIKMPFTCQRKGMVTRKMRAYWV